MSGNWRQNWRRERIERGFPSACKKCGDKNYFKGLTASVIR